MSNAKPGKKDIWARVDERDVKAIDQLAKRLRLSRSAVAGLLIMAGLKHVKGDLNALYGTVKAAELREGA